FRLIICHILVKFPLDLLNPEEVSLLTTTPSTSISLQVFEFDMATVDIQSESSDGNSVRVNSDRRKAQGFTEDIGNSVVLEVVYMPGDEFLMGSPETEAESYDEERPQQQVTVEPFFMGKYPVTQVQWQVVAALPKVDIDLNRNPSFFNGDNRPVECICWYDAVEFCKRLSQITKRNYWLPSEVEWEYACRAGTTTPFHLGETITTELANYNGNYIYNHGDKGEYREQTTLVGSFPANAFGLYDMHGNIWEWCADTLHINYEGAPRDGSAWLKDYNTDNQMRLLRGGSWHSYPENCRCAYRYWSPSTHSSFNIGFRVVRRQPF
ncbi:MAG: formylglycine-generating enzyme family protein, partial [Rhizonema sp. NSF051]|nr:formylglycine-generating enzyme family protein [Rhizonema sp. NSF051]